MKLWKTSAQNMALSLVSDLVESLVILKSYYSLYAKYVFICYLYIILVIVQDFELTKKIMAAEDWSNRAPPAKFVMERSFNKNLG